MFRLKGKHNSWKTPDDLYNKLNSEFKFTLDPCPIHPRRDGLKINWKGHRVYCNPPYGHGIENWIEKAREADLAVYLLPARTDTDWWHRMAMKANEIRFLRGRLKFKGAKYNAPFPSVILIFSKKNKEYLTRFKSMI